jgi:hypothetical protein
MTQRKIIEGIGLSLTRKTTTSQEQLTKIISLNTMASLIALKSAS